MNRYITVEIESDILKYLGEWKTGKYGKKLTWGIISKSFGYSRQALSGNKVIKEAYNDVITTLKDTTSEIDILADIAKENKKLKKEITDANALIHEYEQKYIRWQENAMAKGISVEALNKPIDPTIKEQLRKRTQEN
ncbi:hypothetical protein [Pseudoalteromonas sp. '520P1 No. 423']|nr:hypothetical protein [Pseudoalteromonas sp. '520P1 No. 423']